MTSPDPAAYSGTYDTSGTAGAHAAHTDVRGISGIWDIARAHDLDYALRAIDPEDETVSSSLVQTSPGLTVNRGDPDGDRQRVTAAAARAHAHLQEMGIENAGGAGHPSTAWMGMASSIGPVTTVEEDPHRDRSAG